MKTSIIAQIAHYGHNGIMAKVNCLSEAQIYEIIEEFYNAVLRCQKAGFDGIQPYCAYIYLLAEFLSSTTNKRKDSWGGNSKYRFRIVGEILRRV